MTGAFCPGCGAPVADERADHGRCLARLALEPPRYCGRCGRRMVVQVMPMSWTATCRVHGPTQPVADTGTGTAP